MKCFDAPLLWIIIIIVNVIENEFD